MAGVASLFTREFFEAARARLKPDGLLCQWAHTYDISPGDLQSIVRTFGSVFPQGTLWMVGGGDLLLIGARDGDILPRLDDGRGQQPDRRDRPDPHRRRHCRGHRLIRDAVAICRRPARNWSGMAPEP